MILSLQQGLRAPVWVLFFVVQLSAFVGSVVFDELGGAVEEVLGIAEEGQFWGAQSGGLLGVAAEETSAAEYQAAQGLK